MGPFHNIRLLCELSIKFSQTFIIAIMRQFSNVLLDKISIKFLPMNFFSVSICDSIDIYQYFMWHMSSEYLSSWLSTVNSKSLVIPYLVNTGSCNILWSQVFWCAKKPREVKSLRDITIYSNLDVISMLDRKTWNYQT